MGAVAGMCGWGGRGRGGGRQHAGGRGQRGTQVEVVEEVACGRRGGGGRGERGRGIVAEAMGELGGKGARIGDGERWRGGGGSRAGRAMPLFM